MLLRCPTPVPSTKPTLLSYLALPVPIPMPTISIIILALVQVKAMCHSSYDPPPTIPGQSRISHRPLVPELPLLPPCLITLTQPPTIPHLILHLTDLEHIRL